MTESVDGFLETLNVWAAREPGILAAALVGSHARGTARSESDIDVIIVVDDPASYLQTPQWLEHFGDIRSVSIEDWGLVQSRRVQYADGMEVEFGITVRQWAGTDPIDEGTRQVVSNGMRVLYDPEGLLESLTQSL